MTRVLLSLGSNTDDPAIQLSRAMKHIGHLPSTEILKLSQVIQTAPWGKTDQPDFLNMAILIETRLDVVELMENILIIELKMGRVREEKWGPRIIDIDIILFGNLKFAGKTVIVPHPHMHERLFVLEPAAEIAPEMEHPGSGKTIATLLAECRDRTFVAAEQ